MPANRLPKNPPAGHARWTLQVPITGEVTVELDLPEGSTKYDAVRAFERGALCKTDGPVWGFDDEKLASVTGPGCEDEEVDPRDEGQEEDEEDADDTYPVVEPAPISPPTPSRAQLEERFEAFTLEMAVRVRRYYLKHFPNQKPPIIMYDLLQKYVRVMSGTSAEGFIALHDFENATIGKVKMGDILYAASFMKPARHARGNLFDPDGGFGALNDIGSIRTLR